MKTIRIDVEGHIAHMVLNRPEKRNAMNRDLWEDLGRAGEELQNLKDVRCCILRGEGKSFCAGLDLSLEGNEIVQMMQHPSKARVARDMWDLIRRYKSNFNRLANCPFPMIAALHGHCLGSGFELSLVADFRIAARDTVFSIPEVELGMQPDMGGCAKLARLIGQAQARRLVYTAERIDADEALRIGLVQLVVEPDELMDKAMEMAEKIAGNAPLPVQTAKRVFIQTMDMPLSAAMEFDSVAATTAIIAEDVFEAMAAKLEKRKPDFKAK